MKRAFDIAVSFWGIAVLFWAFPILWLLCYIDTGANGLFVQERIGRNAKPFNILKFRTMKILDYNLGTITTRNDPRITKFGSFMRKLKVDELPQLINVLIGKMSFVGPRPDMKGFADELEGANRAILELRPGITGPASLYFRNEEDLLQNAKDPQGYNQNVIWPTKIKINLDYLDEKSMVLDIKYIFWTIFGLGQGNLSDRYVEEFRRNESSFLKNSYG